LPAIELLSLDIQCLQQNSHKAIFKLQREKRSYWERYLHWSFTQWNS